VREKGEGNGGEKTQRKFKFLAFALIAVFAVSITFASVPSMASWIDKSIVSITAATATATFSTTVTEVATNASSTPLSLTIPGVQNGDPNTPSTVAITAGGFVPNDYVEFQVTIKNTGTATLAFQPYTLNCYFLDSGGNPITSGSWDSGNYAGTFAQQSAWTAFDTPGGALPSGALVGSSSATAFADQMVDHQSAVTYGTEFVTNWGVAWGDGTAAPPATLAPSASYTYYVYVGLGADVPYGIPNMFFSLTIPMMPAT
jgi:hypothetical protein